LGAPAKFQNPRTTHSGRKVCDPEERKKKKERKIILKIVDTLLFCNVLHSDKLYRIIEIILGHGSREEPVPASTTGYSCRRMKTEDSKLKDESRNLMAER
jgi:hypothetical protein